MDNMDYMDVPYEPSEPNEPNETTMFWPDDKVDPLEVLQMVRGSGEGRGRERLREGGGARELPRRCGVLLILVEAEPDAVHERLGPRRIQRSGSSVLPLQLRPRLHQNGGGHRKNEVPRLQWRDGTRRCRRGDQGSCLPLQETIDQAYADVEEWFGIPPAAVAAVAAAAAAATNAAAAASRRRPPIGAPLPGGVPPSGRRCAPPRRL